MSNTYASVEYDLTFSNIYGNQYTYYELITYMANTLRHIKYIMHAY